MEQELKTLAKLLISADIIAAETRPLVCKGITLTTNHAKALS